MNTTTTTPQTIKQQTEAFLIDIDVSEETRKTYRRQLNQFIDWLAKAEILSIDKRTIINYREHLTATGRSQTTVKAYLLAVQHLYGWLSSSGIAENVSKNVRLPKIPTGFRRDFLEIDQAKQLLNTFDTDTLSGLRDYAITNLLLRCGLREIEIIRANVEDIKQHNGQTVLYIQGKGMSTKEEFVILTENAIKPIQNYLEIRENTSPSDPLFVSNSHNNHSGRLSTRSVSRILKTALRTIGLDSPRLTCHSCRHSSLTWARKAGATIEELKLLARHRHISVTINYCHIVDRMGRNAPEYKIDGLLGDI